jgi:hypothetical protein
MNLKKRYLHTKFIKYISEKNENKIEDEDDIETLQKEEIEYDLLSEIIEDLRILEMKR